jgi:hypothetical protein
VLAVATICPFFTFVVVGLAVPVKAPTSNIAVPVTGAVQYKLTSVLLPIGSENVLVGVAEFELKILLNSGLFRYEA